MSLSDYLAPKQLEVLHTYLHDDFNMLVLTGAIRSGKTFIDNLLFIFELRRVAEMAKTNHDKHPQYILAGASSDTINKNVIISCENQFGINFKLDRHGHYSLFGVDITPVSTKTLGGLAGARGFTSYGAYVNEATLGVEPVFQEILQRCSIDGARVIADTNPDNPEHWFKKDYLDNDDPRTKMLKFHFTIDDNTHLSKRYIEGIKARTPSGMFYDRAIRGLWVTGEGVVYRDFDQRTMTIDRKDLPDNLTYSAGVDWGYDHPTAIEVIGRDDKGNYYLVDEAYGQFKQVDPYWISKAKEFQQKYGYQMPFWADTARTEHISNFNQHHINTKYGYKNILDGVEKVAGLIKQHKFYVVKDAAPNFINEIYQYIWDEKTGMPKKENDHAQDAVRYCIATPMHLEEQKKQFPHVNKNKARQTLRRLGI